MSADPLLCAQIRVLRVEWRCRRELNSVSCEASDLQSATLPSRPGTLLSAVRWWCPGSECGLQGGSAALPLPPSTGPFGRAAATPPLSVLTGLPTQTLIGAALIKLPGTSLWGQLDTDVLLVILWRTDRDLNPGDPFGPGPLAGGWFQPLTHPSL